MMIAAKKKPEMIDLNGKGILFIVRQLAPLYNLNPNTLRSRLRRSWSHVRALRTPADTTHGWKWQTTS
jgi:hypothetical protein